MPSVLSYPGVYVQEIPSGVRTITGVSTSVAAFVGAAKRGPINSAVHILSFADFERTFGGLDAGSELSYAVRQFFLNGGSDSWVVRVAANVSTASVQLVDSAAADVMTVTAIDGGKAGNNIQLRVDQQTSNPASSFNLTVSYQNPDNAADSIFERFQNLSMNSTDPRYAERAVNGISGLVTLTRASGLNFGTPPAGSSASGTLGSTAGFVDAQHNQFQVLVNGLPPVTVNLTAADVSGTLAALAAAIQGQVQASSDPVINKVTCAAVGNTLVLTSAPARESSSVRVLPGVRQDLSGLLKLGTFNGGVETETAAAYRPKPAPAPGTVTTGAVAAMAGLPSATENSFQISVDGMGPDLVTFDPGTPFGSLAGLASQIQSAVQKLRPAVPGYKDFSATVSGTDLVFTSGSSGTGSSVALFAAPAGGHDLAVPLNLISGAVAAPGANLNLNGGNDEPYTALNTYNVFVPLAPRQGIFALDSIDFNLLCLPGVSDASTLIDSGAYCKARNTFLIADPPNGKTPDQMATYIKGTSLPKIDCGAVYYPWIDIGDPLNGGKLRATPPSGTVAGLYARTDSTRGVWKAPAGTEASLTGAQALEYELTDGENGILNPLGVNCVRNFPVYGVVSWGARTLNGSDEASSEYKYVPIRRLAQYIEGSLFRGTKWVVFEPNDEPLWGQIRLNLGAFMQTLFRQGAFQGKSPREAYFVKCDKETTTQNDINLGVVNIVVGFAPLKPAEFVVIQIQQIAGQIAV